MSGKYQLQGSDIECKVSCDESFCVADQDCDEDHETCALYTSSEPDDSSMRTSFQCVDRDMCGKVFNGSSISCINTNVTTPATLPTNSTKVVADVKS